MNKKPRREKFDNIKRDVFLDLLRKGIRRVQACKKVGVTHKTFKTYFDNHPEFADEVSQAEIDANELIEQALYNTALKGNVTAQQVWLYNRCPDRWQDRRNIQINTGNSGVAAIEKFNELLANGSQTTEPDANKEHQGS